MSGLLPAYVLLYRSTNEYGEEANVVEGGFRTEQHAKLWADRVVKPGDLIGIIEAGKLTQFVSDHYRKNKFDDVYTHTVKLQIDIKMPNTMSKERQQDNILQQIQYILSGYSSHIGDGEYILKVYEDDKYPPIISDIKVVE